MHSGELLESDTGKPFGVLVKSDRNLQCTVRERTTCGPCNTLSLPYASQGPRAFQVLNSLKGLLLSWGW